MKERNGNRVSRSKTKTKVVVDYDLNNPNNDNICLTNNRRFITMVTGWLWLAWTILISLSTDPSSN